VQKIPIQGYAKDPQLKRKVNAFKTHGLLSSNGIETRASFYSILNYRVSLFLLI
jgi:hypothetical protein